MGDVVGLVEKAREMAVSDDAGREDGASRCARRTSRWTIFSSNSGSCKKMGPIEDLLKMMPGVNRAALEQSKPDLDRLKRYEAIMQSMTMKERRLPRVIDGSRRRRIAAGSGTSVSDVNRLLKDFDQARTMMKRLQARTARHGRAARTHAMTSSRARGSPASRVRSQTRRGRSCRW